MLRAVAQLLVTQPPTLSHSLPLAQSKGESVFEDSDLHVRLPGGVENLNAPLFALPGPSRAPPAARQILPDVEQVRTSGSVQLAVAERCWSANSSLRPCT